MNRKPIFHFLTAVCAISVAACSAAAPTALSSDSSTQAVPPVGVESTSIPSGSSGDVAAAADSNLACSNGSQSAPLTVEETEGPYFTPNSPERLSLLEEGMPGTTLVITGYVYTTDCQPIAGALLDFWQADANGVYDNSGYTLRGHQYTDADGMYQLTTVVPGIYTGRTEHIHVKVQAPSAKLVTTQLFFPGVAQNDSDGIFDQSLLLVMQTTSDGELGQFNFVVPTQ